MLEESLPVKDLIVVGVLTLNDGYRVKLDELGDHGIPFLRAGDVLEGRLNFDGVSFVRQELRDKVANKLSQPGDIVLTTKGTVGRVALVNSGTPQFVYSPQLSFWRVNDQGRIDPRFLRYWMCSPEFTSQMYQHKGQSSMADYISLGDQHRFVISMPTIRIQRRIAEILGALDDKIECNRRINQTLEQMAQVSYKRWFVDFEPFREGEFVDSELGSIPMGWKLAELKSICGVNELTLNTKVAPPTIRYIDISSVDAGYVNRIQEMVFANSPSRARRIVRDGDIVWSMVRPDRKAYFLALKPEPNTIVSTGFAVISPRSVPFSWTYLALTTEQFVSYLASNATGAAYPAVTQSVFEKAKLVVPPDGVLGQFHSNVEPWFRQRAAIHRQNNVLSQMRDYLLPRLLSGQVEVKTAVQEIEAST